MISSPTLPYNGWLFILGNQSRFDKQHGDLLLGSPRRFLFDWFQKSNQSFKGVQCQTPEHPIPPGTKTIVCCGQGAYNAMFDDGYDILDVRGYPRLYQNLPCIPTLYPQDCFDPKNYEKQYNTSTTETQAIASDTKERRSNTARSNYKFWFTRDLERAALCIGGIPAPIPQPATDIYPSIDKALVFLRSTRGQEVVFDIETLPETGQLTCIGLGISNQIVVLPIRKHDLTLAYGNSTGRLLAEVNLLLQTNKIITHNGSGFDLFVWFSKYKLHIPRNNYDTLLAMHRCWPSREKSLGHAMSFLTWQPYHKDSGNYNPHSSYEDQKLWEYNAADIHGTRLVYDALNKQTRHADSITQANKSIYPYVLMAAQGIRMDTTRLSAALKANDDLMTQYLRVLRLLTNTELLPTSSKSMISYFHEWMNYPVQTRSEKTQNPTLNAGALLKLAEYTKNKNLLTPVPALCIKFREFSTESGKLKTPLYHGDRWTCWYKIAGTETFRLSSKKWFDDTGTNLQNLSDIMRRNVIPDPGKIFVQTDQAGAEALVVAYLAGDGLYRKLFRLGIKIHNYLAIVLFKEHWENLLKIDISELFMTPLEFWKDLDCYKPLMAAIKNDKFRYALAKKTCHAKNYGMRENTFIDSVLLESGGTIVLSKQEASFYLTTYDRIFPEVAEFQRRVINYVRNFQNLRNFFGYNREFEGIYIDQGSEKEVLAHCPQSTVGTITNIACTEVQQYIEDHNKKWDLLANTHDSMLGQCDPEEAEEFGKIQRLYLEKTLENFQKEKFQMRSETSIGLNWGKYAEDNKEGMREI